MSTSGTMAILGCGAMGEAVLAGLLRSGTLRPQDVVVTALPEARVAELRERYHVRGTTDNVEAVRASDVILVALKPGVVRLVLDDDALRPHTAGKLVLSVAAGVSLAKLEGWLPEASVMRAMPNTACLIGEGMTALSRGARVDDRQAITGEAIFAVVGRTRLVDEAHMDVITALNGSGPAYAYVIMDALADGAVHMGLPRAIALEMAAQVLKGAARMVLETDTHPAELKDRVTTPGGTTIAGLLALEDGKLRATLAHGIEAATLAAGRLAQRA